MAALASSIVCLPRCLVLRLKLADLTQDTSKDPENPAVHGRRGDFLAAVGTLSFLSVASHHHRHVSQASMSIHNSQVLTRHAPAPPEQRFETFDHGTRVSIRSLFGSMPVRVKHRASMFSERSAVDKE